MISDRICITLEAGLLVENQSYLGGTCHVVVVAEARAVRE
jgi:hypothetical protein